MALPREERERVTESELDEAATLLIARLNRSLFVEDVQNAIRIQRSKRRLRGIVETSARVYQIPPGERKRIFRKLEAEALEAFEALKKE